MHYVTKAIGVSAALIGAMATASTASAAVMSSTQGSGFAIEDESSQASIIKINDPFVISNVTFSLNGLTHSSLADVSATLIHGGVKVTWLDGFGIGVSVDGDYLISDTGATTIYDGSGYPRTSGTYNAFDPLSVFNGMSAAGDWTLTIDDGYLGDDGNLNSWTLNLTAVPSAVPEPSTWAMMILGMGAVGIATRRRKSRIRVSYRV